MTSPDGRSPRDGATLPAHRKVQLLAGCQVPTTVFRGVMSRLESLVQPFVTSLPSPESRTHSRTYIAGLLSDVERKNAESIAYRYDLDRQVIQRFVGEVVRISRLSVPFHPPTANHGLSGAPSDEARSRD